MKKEQSKSKLIAKIQNLIERALNYILLTVSLLFLFVGVYALVDNHLVVISAEIPKNLKESSMGDREYPNIAELQKTNPEIVAWLTIDDTQVDYPVTKNKDNVKYLTKDYKGEYALSGNPFVDYRNNFLKDDYTVIYGHRMNQKKMFGSLVQYIDASFMQKHQTGTITTKEGTYKLEVVLYSVEDINKTKIYNLVTNRNDSNPELLKGLAKTASTINGKYTRAELGDGESRKWKLLLLSTCDKDSKHYRDIVLFKIGDKV